MAVLKDLIVHGRSRFINGIDADSIHANLIDANDGIFKTITTTTLDAETITTDMLTAQNARVAQTLTVDGTISTNKWEAANIANIGGNFYISPTGKADSGNITVTKTGSTTINGVSVGVYTLVVGGASFGVTSTSSTIWGTSSKVIFTGSIAYNSSKKYPLGTCNGTMTSVSTGSGTLTGFTITGVNSPALDVFFKEQGVTSVSSTACTGYEMQISVYQSYYSSALHPIGILLTSYGKDKKQYIDIYGGANTLGDSASGFANPSVRIGQLDGLPNIVDGSTDSTTAPSGWGIYTTNGFFKGKIVSNAGRIAGWNISDTALYNGSTGINNTTSGAYLGYATNNTGLNVSGGSAATTITIANSNFTKTINGTSYSTLRVAIGSNFGMDSSGNIYANGANITNINANNISTNMLSAMQAVVSNLSVLRADMGTITAGVIKHDTVGGTNGIWFSAATDTSSNVTVGTSGARKDWRLLVNNKFGVTTGGVLYASGGSFNGRIEATEGYINSSITIGSGGTALSTVQSNASNGKKAYDLQYLSDTRNTNENPQYYITNYPRKQVNEFKSTSVIGLSGSAYCTLTTVVPWDDSSGGYPKQEADVNGKRYWREGTSATTWSAWVDAEAVATNYITNIDSNGIWVTPSGKKPTNTSTGAGATGTKIDGTGVGIYVGGVKLAQYGTTTYFYEPDGTTAATLDGTGLNIKTGTITLGSNFQVTSTGILTATEAILKSVSLRDSNNKTRAAIDTNGLHVYDSNGNVKADFGTNIVLYGGSTTTSGNLLIQNNQITLRDNTRELFTVKTNEEIISVNYSIEQVALLTGEIYCEFQAGRTISTVKSVTFAYTVSGTQRLQTYNSEATAPSGTSATYFNSLSIKASSDKTKIICSFAPKSNSTIVNYVTVTFTTTDVTSYILAGSYPNLSHSHILKLGNGTSTSSTANALAVGWDGTGHFSGDVIAYCMSDSKGGISLGEYKPAGYYSWGDGSQSAGTERRIEVEAYRCGRMVQLTAVLQPWDVNVSSGSNICNLNINGSGIPKPPDNVSGVAYYGARPIIGTLWNDGSTLRLTIRNLGTTAFSVSDSALRLSIVYMTEY